MITITSSACFSFALFILMSLACYRLSLMLSKENGPGGIFRRLRNLPDPEKHEMIYEGLRCLWCVSVWFGAALTVYALFMHWIALALAPVYMLALSATAILIERIVTRDHK